AVQRDHAPEEDDGGRRYALRRHDGRRRGLADRLAAGRVPAGCARERVSRSWAELLGEEEAAPEPEAERAGVFSRLRDSLSKSRRAFSDQLAAVAFDPADEAAWGRREEATSPPAGGVRAAAGL